MNPRRPASKALWRSRAVCGAPSPGGMDFGSREYHACDVEWHPWTFGTFLPAGAGDERVGGEAAGRGPRGAA